MAIFEHVWPKSTKMRIFIKNRSVLFFTLIVPQLYAEFQKNRWSVKGDITEPVALAGSIYEWLVTTSFTEQSTLLLSSRNNGSPSASGGAMCLGTPVWYPYVGIPHLGV